MRAGRTQQRDNQEQMANPRKHNRFIRPAKQIVKAS
jgi:hypothetical protein